MYFDLVGTLPVLPSFQTAGMHWPLFEIDIRQKASPSDILPTRLLRARSRLDIPLLPGSSGGQKNEATPQLPDFSQKHALTAFKALADKNSTCDWQEVPHACRRRCCPGLNHDVRSITEGGSTLHRGSPSEEDDGHGLGASGAAALCTQSPVPLRTLPPFLQRAGSQS